MILAKRSINTRRFSSSWNCGARRHAAETHTAIGNRESNPRKRCSPLRDLLTREDTESTEERNLGCRSRGRTKNSLSETLTYLHDLRGEEIFPKGLERRGKIFGRPTGSGSAHSGKKGNR